MRIKNIDIDLGFDDKDEFELAEALRLIAKDIENGYNSGIVGMSDVSWSIEISDESED